MLEFTSLIGYKDWNQFLKELEKKELSSGAPVYEVFLLYHYKQEWDNENPDFEEFLKRKIWTDWGEILGYNYGWEKDSDFYLDFPVRLRYNLENVGVDFDVQLFDFECHIFHRDKKTVTKEEKSLWGIKKVNEEVNEDINVFFFPFESLDQYLIGITSGSDKSIEKKWERPFTNEVKERIKNIFNLIDFGGDFSEFFKGSDKLKEEFIEQFFIKEISFFEFLLEKKIFKIGNDDYEFLNRVNDFVKEMKLKLNNLSPLEAKEIKNLQNEIKSFDKDGNGIIDIVEVSDEFEKLVKKNQSKIIDLENGKSYIQKFVKISNFLKSKRDNIQLLFPKIINSKESKEIIYERIEYLKNNIHSYEVLLLHSLNMIGALIEDDVFTFYEIYEVFDKLNVFETNYEKQLSENLSNLNDSLNDLVYKINSIDNKIISGFRELGYLQESSYESLNASLTNELKSIGSSINLNTLLTGINAYQTYKLKSK